MPEESKPKAEFAGDALSVNDVVKGVRTHPFLIIGVVSICAALALLISFLMKPVYRAAVVLSPVKEEGGGSLLSGLPAQLGGLASVVGMDFGSLGSKDEFIAILGSQAFTGEFIERENLMPELFADLWDADAETWNVRDADDIPTAWDAFNYFDTKIRSISVDKRTGLITLEIFWIDPNRAATWANELVSRVNRAIRDKTIEESQRSILYLNEQLAKTNIVGVEQAIYRLMEEQLNRIMYASVRDEYAFKVLDPAVASDVDVYVRPNRPLMFVLGAFFGGVLGVLIAVFRFFNAR